MAEKAKPVHGPGRHAGPGKGRGPQVKHPGKIIRRLMAYVMRKYLLAVIVVMACIIYTAFASVQGTLFMQELIDGYILPLLESESPDFGDLLQAITRVGIYYGIAVIASYAQVKIMIYVSQGTLRDLRNDLFSHMEKLPADPLF